MRVLGVDCSTRSLAFSIIKDGELEAYGEIYFRETTPNARLYAMRKQLEDLVTIFGEIDYVGFEQAVKVVSVTTMIALAESFGVAKSVLMELGAKLVEVTPLAWQSYIGNPNLSAAGREKFYEDHPEFKTKSQRSSAIRQYRKNKTIDFMEEKTGVRVISDNISDSYGIAFYVNDNLEKIQEKLNGKG
jgi:hypothetical protein